MMGANPAGLANLIKTHAGAAPPAGTTSGAGSSSTPAEPGVVSPTPSPLRQDEPGILIPRGRDETQESLLPQVHTAQLTCLNESAGHGIKTIIGSSAGPKGSSYLESESDPELLIFLPVSPGWS